MKRTKWQKVILVYVFVYACFMCILSSKCCYWFNCILYHRLWLFMPDVEETLIQNFEDMETPAGLVDFIFLEMSLMRSFIETRMFISTREMAVLKSFKRINNFVL